jgi:5-bromo-4-chloroindolyl phosphate hydrolysis protein
MDKSDVLYAISIFIFFFFPLMGGMFYVVSIIDPIANHLETINRRQENHEERLINIEDNIVDIVQMREELEKIRNKLEQLQKEKRNEWQN